MKWTERPLTPQRPHLAEIRPKIDLGEPLNRKTVKDALHFAVLIVGSSVAFAQIDYLARPSAAIRDSLCRADFNIAMDGWVGPGVERAKSECSLQYSRWITELPPTSFRITGEGISVGRTTLSRKGLRIRKGHLVVVGVSDIAFPAIYLHHEQGDITLRFQTPTQADTAFNSLSAWMLERN